MAARYIALIPAYEPDRKMLGVIADLGKSGFDIVVVDDGSGTEYHAWNLVEIGGVWYNLDVTWDKMLKSDAYYLKTDQSMEDHVRDERFTTKEFYAQYPMAEKDFAN